MPNQPRDTEVEVTERVEIGTRVGLLVALIAGTLAGVSLAAALFFSDLLEPKPPQPPAPPFTQARAIQFSTDEVLVKFDPSVSENQQDVIVKNIIEKPRKIQVDELTGAVIQRQLGQTSSTTGEATKTVDLEAKVQRVEEVYPEVSLQPSKGSSSVAQPSSATFLPFRNMNWKLVRLSGDMDIATLVGDFLKDERVVDAQPNFLHSLYFTPNDPYYSSSGSWGQSYADLWGIRKMNSAQAWDTNLNFSIKRGDVNRSQKVDLADIVSLSNYLFKHGPAPEPLVLGDVNNDGKVTGPDVQYLTDYVLKGGPAPVGAPVGPTSITAAVVDTGVDYTHPDIKDKIWTNEIEIPANGVDDDRNGYIDDVRGWDFAGPDGESQDNDPMDGHGHGTHVAGTIAATINNGAGVAGICIQCKIMPLKAADNGGGLRSADLAEAILYAANNGAKVINNSWGSLANDSLIQEALDEAYAKGLTLVFAAGNFNADVQYFYPRSEKLIMVAATGPDDTPTYFTNYGSRIDVAAPGLDILSLRAGKTDMYGDGGKHVVGTNYFRASGTSMAAPHVVGLVSLILSQNPWYGPEDVRAVLRYATDDISEPGWDMRTGYGRVNAYKALSIKAPCISKVQSPAHWDDLKTLAKDNAVEITGTASCQNLLSYKLEFGRGTSPSAWQLIGESKNQVVGGVLAEKWDISKLEQGEYTIRLSSVDASQRIFVDRVYVRVAPQMHAGFPVAAAESYMQSPTVDDIDGDGQSDIIVPPYALRGNGTTLPGWPNAAYTGDTFVSNASVADLDLSYPGKEVAFMMNGKLYLLHADGSKVNGAWPKDLPDYNLSSPVAPVLADLDGNGKFEVITSYESTSYKNTPALRNIYIWNIDGTIVAGWPQKLSVKDGDGQVSVGNVDKDPELELSVPPRVYNHDGSRLVTLPNCGEMSLPLADLDGDGTDEIVCTAYLAGEGKLAISLYNAKGDVLDGWPQTVKVDEGYIGIVPYVLPTVADLNGDKLPEIIVAAKEKVYVFDFLGRIMPGWPISQFLFLNANPVVADIDGDQDLEVVVAGFFGQIFAYNHDGTPVPGFPLFVPNRDHWQWGSPAVADIDGDSKLELVAYSQALVSSAGEISAFDLSGTNTAWPQYNYDARKTGNAKGFPTTNLQAEIKEPAPNNEYTIGESIIVKGTASGKDFSRYTLEYGKGIRPSAWTQFGQGSSPIISASLGTLQTSGLSSPLTMKLKVYDSQGRKVEERITIYEKLVADIVSPIDQYVYASGETIQITGTASGKGFARFELSYGKGTSPNAWTWFKTSYTPVVNGSLGSFSTTGQTTPLTFRLQVFQQGGLIKEDLVSILPKLIATITSPADNTGYCAGCTVSVMGSAGGNGFKSYTLEYGLGLNPSSWKSIKSSSTPTTGLLGYFLSGDISNDVTLRLRVTPGAGFEATAVTHIYTKPEAAIGHPRFDSQIAAGDLLEIGGTAVGRGFVSYTLQYRKLEDPPDRTTIILTSGTPVINGLLGKLDTTNLTPSRYVMLLSVFDGKGVMASTSVEFFLGPSRPRDQAGWPQYTGYQVVVPLNVADLDPRYPGREVVALTVGRDLIVWHADGTLVEGWPQTLDRDPYSYSMNICCDGPIIADLDPGYSGLEIIVGMTNFPYTSLPDRVYAFHRDGTAVTGWPFEFASGELNAPIAVADVDPDRAGSEVVIATSTGNLFVVSNHGTQLPGWPISMKSVNDFLPFTFSVPTVADIDPSVAGQEIVVPYGVNTVHAYHRDGSEVAGWPQNLQMSWSPHVPVVGDVDGDHQLEIVLSDDHFVYVWNGDGTPVPGWPKDLGACAGCYGSIVTLSDIDLDGSSEIIFIPTGYGLSVNVWNGDGTPVPGWPRSKDGLWSNGTLPVVGDINSDGKPDIIVLADPDRILAFSNDGTDISGWPKGINNLITQSSPVLADLDGDGDVELLFTTYEGSVRIWDLDGQYNASVTPWPMFRHDPGHSGAIPLP